MNVQQIARAAARNPDVVRRWLRAGELPGRKLRNGEWDVFPDGLAIAAKRPRVERRAPSE